MNGVKKVDAIEKNVAELVDGLRVMEMRVKDDIEELSRDLVTRSDAMEAKYQYEIASIREQLHYTCVKKETAEHGRRH